VTAAVQRFRARPREVDAVLLPDGRYVVLGDVPRYCSAIDFLDAFEVIDPIGGSWSPLQGATVTGTEPNGSRPTVRLSERPLPPDDGLDISTGRRTPSARQRRTHEYDLGEPGVDQVKIEEVVQAAKRRSAWRTCKCGHAAYAKSKCDHCGAPAPARKTA